MNRRDLIRRLVAHQCHLHRHGGGHDIYINVRNGRKAPIPRHSEIRESLVKLILKQLDVGIK